jgi:hypothetical protein
LYTPYAKILQNDATRLRRGSGAAAARQRLGILCMQHELKKKYN